MAQCVIFAHTQVNRRRSAAAGGKERIMLSETWQRLRLLGVVGAAGATVIIRWSAAKLVGQDEPRTGIGIGEHR